jgi:Fur family transcriptional regulator, zinc uptake regulator
MSSRNSETAASQRPGGHPAHHGAGARPFAAHDHAGCAADALARAEGLAADGALKLTPVRRRVLEILLEDHRALGAYDILGRLTADGFANQPPVVYRALEALVAQGLAHRVEAVNAYLACTSPGADHRPAFLVCRLCAAVAEAPAAGPRAALDAAAEALGFSVEKAAIEVVGLCPACRPAEAQT